MCGLLGYYSYNYLIDPVEMQSKLLAAQQTLLHRGPDDRGA
jgi:asparagine synthetase B (glutamine-hydrolysing)